MKLNCDLGESYGNWTLGLDEQVMPYLDQANIACGFHAGDPMVIKKTIATAKKYKVTIGAHPAYPDLQGFGRRSLKCSEDEIIALIQYQVAALDGMAKSMGVELDYVKPHGALYNDMMNNESVRISIFKAISTFYKPLTLMIQATAQIEQHRAQADNFNVNIWTEAFADRCYADDGKLLARTQPGAVHSKLKMLAQVKQLKQQGTVTSENGKIIHLKPDSLCVHGDTPDVIQTICEIKKILS